MICPLCGVVFDDPLNDDGIQCDICRVLVRGVGLWDSSEMEEEEFVEEIKRKVGFYGI